MQHAIMKDFTSSSSMCCISNIYETKKLKKELLIDNVSEVILNSVQEQKMTSL